MTTYSDWTKQVGDQWVAALQRVEGAIGVVAESSRTATEKFSLPQIEVPEQLTTLGELAASQLPKPSEIIDANFELATRLLAAQRELAVKLVEANASVGQNPSDATE